MGVIDGKGKGVRGVGRVKVSSLRRE